MKTDDPGATSAEKWKKWSVRRFFHALRSQIQAEKNGFFPSQPSRWGVGTTLFAFFLLFSAVFCVVLIVGEAFWPAFFPKAAFFSGGVILFTGLFLIFTSCIIKSKYGVIVDFAVSMAIRTGIPLAAALAFFWVFDNIILNVTILTMVVFYLAMLPFEVWVMLPGSRKSAEKPAPKNETKR